MGSRLGGGRRDRMTRSSVIGVTGGIATGKSTVLSALSDLGAEVIDADRVYHELIDAGQPLNAILRNEFGPAIAAPDGTIDRSALGRLVFRDAEGLARLEALTHPAVIAEIERRLDAVAVPVVAVDAVKLVESGMDRLCDAVWLVTLDRDAQIERLMARNGLSLEEAIRRIDAHRPSNAVRERADVVIDNGGPVEATRRRVAELWRDFLKLSFRQ